MILCPPSSLVQNPDTPRFFFGHSISVFGTSLSLCVRTGLLATNPFVFLISFSNPFVSSVFLKDLSVRPRIHSPRVLSLSSPHRRHLLQPPWGARRHRELFLWLLQDVVFLNFCRFSCISVWLNAYPLRGALSLLNRWGYVFCQIWKFFCHYVFKYSFSLTSISPLRPLGCELGLWSLCSRPLGVCPSF